jgi:aspartate/methionine/tyrosine aminotransferase
MDTARRMESLPFSGIRAVMEKAVKMEQSGEKIIHMELGRSDFDTPEVIKQAVYDSIQKGNVFYTCCIPFQRLQICICAIWNRRTSLAKS